jgi:flagellar biosynthetic protein FlhB
MAEGDQGDDRTETATARHLDHAREDGQVPMSRELTMFVGLAAAVLVLRLQSPAMMQRLLPDLVAYLSRTGDGSMLGSARMQESITSVVIVIAPTMLAATAAGAAAVLLQTRFLIHLGALQLKISRVSPMAGVKRVFGFNGIVEIIKSLSKLAILTLAIWIAVGGDWASLVRMPSANPRDLLAVIWPPVFHLFVAGLVTQGIIAAADLGWVHFRHARDMRMSKQDIRDEMKDTDGNPHVKARIRSIRVMRARRRMMQKVPTATVVVTNPTHYAVALAYDRAINPAPRLVAKGADTVAARIREIAEANGVPIVANPPLARALYRLDLDIEIPAEHYKAVAEIIAYIWRLRGARRAAVS